MSYVALLADASTAAADQTPPWWVSGLWGLLGTVIGGFITYVTSILAQKRDIAAQRDREAREAEAERERVKRDAEAERERERKEQIIDVGTRYIQAVSRQANDSINVRETMAEFQEMLKSAAQIGDEARRAEALKALQAATKFDPKAMNEAMQGDDAQLKMLGGLMQGASGLGPSLSELTTLVAEMRLLLPTNVVSTAEVVSAVIVGLASFSPAVPPAARLAMGGMFTEALNVFVNQVRLEVGLDLYAPQGIDGGLLGAARKLQELAEHQKRSVVGGSSSSV